MIIQLLRHLIQRWRERVREPECTGNPDGMARFKDFNDSHDWYEFGDNEWECLECNLVIGWPDKRTQEQMGVTPTNRE